MMILTPIANAMLDFTIFIVLRAILRINESLRRSSSISTISAASIAASDPSEPMAIPTSALMRTGASLIPSPTYPSLPSPSHLLPISFSNSEILSAGSSSYLTSSNPSSFATVSAAACLSPLSITVLRMPSRLTAAILSFAFFLTVSEITMYPLYTPSYDTNVSVPASAVYSSLIFEMLFSAISL